MAVYTCQICERDHEELPAIAYNSPHNYHILSDEDKANIAELSEEFCIIQHEDQTDRFIRAVLFQKIVDHKDTLDYGVWVSLSEKSFNDYQDSFNSTEHEATTLVI